MAKAPEPQVPLSRLRIIRITHPENQEVEMTFINIAYIVSVDFFPHQKCTRIFMANGDVHFCTEPLDTILTQIRTPG